MFDNIPKTVRVFGVVFKLMFVSLYKPTIERAVVWFRVTVGGWETVVGCNPFNWFGDEGQFYPEKVERDLAVALLREVISIIDPKRYYGNDYVEDEEIDIDENGLPVIVLWNFKDNVCKKFRPTLGELGCHI